MESISSLIGVYLVPDLAAAYNLLFHYFKSSTKVSDQAKSFASSSCISGTLKELKRWWKSVMHHPAEELLWPEARSWAKPSLTFGFWPGSRFGKAKARSSQAKAGAFRPSWSWHITTCDQPENSAICLPTCSFGHWLVFRAEGDQIEQDWMLQSSLCMGIVSYAGYIGSGNGGSGGRGSNIGLHNHMTYNHIVVNGVSNGKANSQTEKCIRALKNHIKKLENIIREIIN
ncbi:hypothetical protein CPB84DRAFT_1748788 [Gymnopilus junonius]|uniref:Uncharacterized protein n=1 Tax=Gymnopilus junonius TaxID=109634 RepID=A0A9P5TM12_GYMJU|nr:hypothetical protein CPB84DRAFT_1748788 [Gymnopilus junonius]